jgi:hypothetical protein
MDSREIRGDSRGIRGDSREIRGDSRGIRGDSRGIRGDSRYVSQKNSVLEVRKGIKKRVTKQVFHTSNINWILDLNWSLDKDASTSLVSGT